MILGEAKNWGEKVETKEYTIFRDKMEQSSGTVKTGFLVTSSTFTEGVYLAAFADRRLDLTVVLLHRVALESIWRDYGSITAGVEDMLVKAIEDQSQRRL